MNSTDLRPTNDNAPAPPSEVIQALGQVVQVMRGMADTLRATNERVDQLEAQMRQLVPLTSGQESALCANIRNRAQTLAKQYQLNSNGQRAIATAIRRAVKLTGGVRSVRELPRALYSVYVDQVGLWEDYQEIKTIKAKGDDHGKD